MEAVTGKGAGENGVVKGDNSVEVYMVLSQLETTLMSNYAGVSLC